nr:myosin-2-like isoform X1 [Ipomoea batatas]
MKLTNSSPRLLPKSREAEWADTIDYFIKEKLRIWCREQNGQWELGTILSTTGEIASVLFSDGNGHESSHWRDLTCKSRYS